MQLWMALGARKEADGPWSGGPGVEKEGTAAQNE